MTTKRISWRPREVAEATGLTRRYIYQLVKEGKLRAKKVGAAVLIPDSEVRRVFGV